MGGRLLLGAAVAVLLPVAAAARPVSPPWKIECGKGGDEFASNCLALAEARGFRFELSTGDSQFFVNVTAPACPLPEGYSGRNWWRDQIAFMDYAQRRKLVQAALRDSAAEIARRCPHASRTPPAFDEIPDIAALGEPGL
ncbi:MAG: hypothetical protein ACM3W4_02515 [Ignavibacteriales bacterium]